MKPFAFPLLVSVASGIVCSFAHAKASKPVLKKAHKHLIQRISTGRTKTATVLAGVILEHSNILIPLIPAATSNFQEYLPAPAASRSNLRFAISIALYLPAPAASRIEKFAHDFAEYVPLQRAVILRQLGLPLHDLLVADDHDFRDAVLMKAMRLKKPYGHVPGDKLLDTGLEKYFPSVYELAADDVLDSAEALDDFGNPVNTRSSEQIFGFARVVSIINSSLGNTGRRAIIDNLNRLDFDETRQLMHRVSHAWNLRVLQAGSDLEAARQTGVPNQSPLDDQLNRIISHQQDKLEKAEERRSKTPFFAPSAQEIEQLEREVDALKKIAAMPHSPERGTALVEFHADYLTNSNEILNFTDKDLEWLKRNKIGQALLHDVTPPALAALSQISKLYSNYVPVDLRDVSQRQQQLLDLLEEELQQALAAK